MAESAAKQRKIKAEADAEQHALDQEAFSVYVGALIDDAIERYNTTVHSKNSSTEKE